MPVNFGARSLTCDSLARVRYGAFEDDVVDMVLVDPTVLVNAKPLRTPQRLRTSLSLSKRRSAKAAAPSPSVQPPAAAGGYAKAIKYF
jgi:hypothetical protein